MHTNTATPRRRAALPPLAVVLAAALSVCCTSALAQDEPASRPGAPPEVRRKLLQNRQLMGRLVEALRNKDYAAGLAVSQEAAAAFPESPDWMYNVACCQARLGRKDTALASLTKAVELGWAAPFHMKTDADLEPLRGEPQFAKLLRQTDANRRKTFAPYEKGKPIPGVKTVEGDPADGLRWRLRMSPKANDDNMDRLILWLHPAGGSMNRHVEALAKGFIDRGFALLVLTEKDFRGWSAGDARRLLQDTLADVAGAGGVDILRPVLLGYSAGGQLAMNLYQTDPGRYGGVALVAAYPVVRTGARKVRAFGPPNRPGAAGTPVVVFVGTEDGGANVWRAAEKAWNNGSIPFRIHYVPGKGHTWLIDTPRRKLLFDWLETLDEGSGN